MGLDSIINLDAYRDYFDQAFPEFSDDQRYTNECAGLAIAAYERTLLANKAPFQEWLAGNKAAMTEKEKEGALLFFGKAGCVNCHTGPALNSMAFYALGIADFEGGGIYGDSPDEATKKGRGGFTGNPEDMFKFKVPQLYSLRYSPFYGHGATFHTIREIIEYKNAAIPENDDVPNSQIADYFVPLGLTDTEIDRLVSFIENALDDRDLLRYEPVSVPSGNCVPNNDPQSRIDLGCD
jgi:cytochrome c peroxidase